MRVAKLKIGFVTLALVAMSLRAQTDLPPLNERNGAMTMAGELLILKCRKFLTCCETLI